MPNDWEGVGGGAEHAARLASSRLQTFVTILDMHSFTLHIRATIKKKNKTTYIKNHSMFNKKPML
jgi:hypothetical protein